MPTYTNAYLKSIHALTPSEEPLSLIEVKHALFDPIRLVLSNCQFVSNGKIYAPCSLSIVYPDDQEKQIPKCSIAFANTSDEFSIIFDQTLGVQNGSVAIFRVMPSQPDTVQGGILDMYIESVSMTVESIQLTLGFDQLDNRAAMRILYNAEYSPSLFS